MGMYSYLLLRNYVEICLNQFITILYNSARRSLGIFTSFLEIGKPQQVGSNSERFIAVIMNMLDRDFENIYEFNSYEILIQIFLKNLLD